MPTISLPPTKVTEDGPYWRDAEGYGIDKLTPGLVVVPDPPTIEDGAYTNGLDVWVRHCARWASSAAGSATSMDDQHMADCVQRGLMWPVDLSKPKETP